MHAMELQHTLFQILTPDITKFIIFVKIQIYFINLKMINVPINNSNKMQNIIALL